MMPRRRTNHWGAERKREVRRAAACGALVGTAVGTLVGIPFSLYAWVVAGNRAALAAFVGIWVLWVALGALACWIAAVVGGMQLADLMKWCAGLGAVGGLLMALVPSSPFGAAEAIIANAAGGAVLALVVSYAWWRHLARR
jgi:hypothetical protein